MGHVPLTPYSDSLEAFRLQYVQIIISVVLVLLYHIFQLCTSIEPYGLSVQVSVFMILLLLFSAQFIDISHGLAYGPSRLWEPCSIPGTRFGALQKSN